MEAVKALLIICVLFFIAIACEGVVADALRNAGLTGFVAELFSGSFVTYALVRSVKQ